MPQYKYNLRISAYVKMCSCCKVEIVGTKDEAESLTIFKQHFAQSNGAGMADGLQSRCRGCNTHRRRSLGVTTSILHDMFEAQNGKCAICTREISIEMGATDKAHVDHDDNTGKVRELLCQMCNQGIGLFRHNPELLLRAKDYITKHTPVVPIRRRI